MNRLLYSLAAALVLLTPFAAQADRDRDWRDHSHFDRRFDRHDRAFERRFGDRRFHDHRRFDDRLDRWQRNEPWRGHRGWRDFGSRRFDQFHPGTRAFDPPGPRVSHRLHGPTRHPAPHVRHGHRR